MTTMKHDFQRRPAFALTAAFCLMAFLLLLAIASSVFLSLQTKAGAAECTRRRARLNALAATRIALGELQTAVGPDRRATADASLPESDDSAGFSRRWVGVLRTDRLKDEKTDAPPFVHRDDAGVALVDDRYRHVGRDFHAEKEFLRRLVSRGDEPGAASFPRREIFPATGDTPAVYAPRVVSESGDISFAWWASDENTKAFIGPGPKPGTEKDFSLPRGAGLALLPGWNAAGRRPATTPASAPALVAEALLDAQKLGALAHDFTTVAAGVLADGRAGGLRTDVTPFLLSTGREGEFTDDSPAVVDTPAAPGPFVHAGPRWGMFRAWVVAGGKPGDLTPSAGTRHRVPDTGKASEKFHDGTHPDLPDVLAPTAPVIAPVLVEAAVYSKLSGDDSRRNKDGAPWLRLHLHPRVVLWNPYAAPLAPARYLVHLRMNGSPVFTLVNAKAKLTGAISGWRVYDNTKVNYATTQGTLLFVLDCPRLAAGESKLFLPPATAPLYGKSAGTKTYRADANVLVPATANSNANFYLEDYDAFEDAGVKALAGVSLAGEKWRCENSAGEDFAAALSLMPPGAGDWNSLRAAPTLRYASVSVKGGSGTTPVAGWPAGRTETLSDDGDAPPPPGMRDGIRLRWLNEPAANRSAYSPSGHADIAPLENFNPTAPLAFIHPFENFPAAASAAGGRKTEMFGLYTRDAPDAATEPEALKPVGGVVAHPFGPASVFPGVSRVVATGFPKSPGFAVSWAEFSDVPFSAFAWHPLRTPGESGITPVTPADATAHTRNAVAWADLASGGKFAMDAVRLTERPEFPRVADMRFEMNHALWDRFTLLTGDAVRRAAFESDPLGHPLPNPLLIPAPGAVLHGALTGDRPTKTGPAAVLLAGAFNVNSTSVIAWEQWLARARGLDATGVPSPVSGDKTPFAKFPANPGDACDRAPAANESGLWRGHRRLSDDEIRKLAGAIVEEVKLRGPFLSLSDFVNRRLSDDPVNLDPANPSLNACGALAAAIAKSGLNDRATPSSLVTARVTGHPGTKHLPVQKAWSRAESASGFLTQGDLLKTGGALLAARGDTFLLRVRAESGGASAVYETVVQRLPRPLIPDPENPDEPGKKTARQFGRRLVILSMREVDAGE